MAEKAEKAEAAEKARAAEMARKELAEKQAYQEKWAPLINATAYWIGREPVRTRDLTSEQAREWLGIAQEATVALREAGVSEEKIRFLMETAEERKIVVGMPVSYVVLAWGVPRDTNRNSLGDQHWWYGPVENSTYLSFERGILTYWSK